MKSMFKNESKKQGYVVSDYINMENVNHVSFKEYSPGSFAVLEITMMGGTKIVITKYEDGRDVSAMVYRFMKEWEEFGGLAREQVVTNSEGVTI